MPFPPLSTPLIFSIFPSYSPPNPLPFPPFPPTFTLSKTIPLPAKIKTKIMHLIDRQPQIQWSIALQLGLFGHLATVLTRCTLQLSLSRTVSQWSVNIGWNCIITLSLQGLAGFNHSVALLVLCHCADVCMFVAQGSLDVVCLQYLWCYKRLWSLFMRRSW